MEKTTRLDICIGEHYTVIQKDMDKDLTKNEAIKTSSNLIELISALINPENYNLYIHDQRNMKKKQKLSCYIGREA